MGGDHQATLERTVDLVPLDQAAHGRLAVLCQVPKVARMLLAEPGFQFSLRLAVPGMDLSAIAARGGEADPFRFQQHHARAALRQMQRRRQSGITAADHAHIRAPILRQRGAGRSRSGRGGVIALGGGRVHAEGVTLRIEKVKDDLDPKRASCEWICLSP